MPGGVPQIHPGYASSAIHVLARTSWLTRSMGSGRLPLPPVSVRIRSITGCVLFFAGRLAMRDSFVALEGHKYIRPKSIHDSDIVDEYAKYYMYFACIKFINSVGCTTS